MKIIQRLRSKKESLGILLILVVLLVPSIYSLLLPGFFQTDDGEWMVIRFSAFYQALSDGQFPVRFLGRLNFGYGYPVANFLYPGFMYIATPLSLLGIGFVSSIKIIMALSMLGGGFFTFLWLSRVFSRTSALVGAVFFAYTPYHLFDLYKRGSVGEILSLSIASFIFWAIEEKNKLFITIGIFLLAISHNTLFLFFVPMLFLYGLIRKKLSFIELVISFGLGMLMSSFFTIPAVIELGYTNFSNLEISNYKEYFASISLIGYSSFVVLIFSIVLLYLKKFKERKEVYFFILLSVFSIFFSMGISEILWKVIPSSLIQFPFRFLSFIIFSSAFLSSYIVSTVNKNNKVVIIALILIVGFSSIGFLIPSERFDKGDLFYSTNEASTTVKDEYNPKWVKEKPTSRFSEKVETESGQGVSNLIYNSKNISFEKASDTEENVIINTIYYPGWKALVNKKETEINYYNPKGVMEINLPKGENQVKLVFSETPIRIFSDILSIGSFILLIFLNRKKLTKIIKK